MGRLRAGASRPGDSRNAGQAGRGPSSEGGGLVQARFTSRHRQSQDISECSIGIRNEKAFSAYERSRRRVRTRFGENEGIDCPALGPNAWGRGMTLNQTEGISMRKTMISAAAALLVASVAPQGANAFPLAAPYSGNASITLVAGGCGPAFHRNPFGFCVRNAWGPRPYPYGWHRCWVRETPWGPRRVCR